tara:strand:+ start:270 stop:497 length:228 start_codon:yes stop_codon:yes gene_type:complete
MSEKKSVRQLERELKAARIEERREQVNKVEKNRDYSVAGIDKDTTVEKKIPSSADIPDVIILPKKAKNRKENIPF